MSLFRPELLIYQKDTGTVRKKKVPGEPVLHGVTSCRLSQTAFAGILPADCQTKAPKAKRPGPVEFRVKERVLPKGQN